MNVCGAQIQMLGEHVLLLPAELVFAVVLAGPIPPELGNLAALQEELNLWGNKLHGESVGERVDRIPPGNVRMNVGGTQVSEAGRTCPATPR